MAIPIPISAVVNSLKWIYSKAFQKLFIATYRTSHEFWAKRHTLGARWSTLYQDIEYSIHLAQPTDPKPRVSKIAFRSKDQSISKLSLLFEAQGSGVRYQENIYVRDINRQPISISLPNVPCVDVIFSAAGGIGFSIESFRFRDGKIDLTDGTVIHFEDSLESHLTQTWLMNDEWFFRWGAWWNCNEIKWAKNRIREYWIFRFGRPNLIVYSPFSEHNHKRRLLAFFASIVGATMASKPFVVVQFWAAIWSGRYVLTDNGLRKKSKLSPPLS